MAAVASPLSISGLFWKKTAYEHVAKEFHPFHRHDLNVLLHFFTTGLGLWGAVQLAVLCGYDAAVHVYVGLVLLTAPMLTGILHTLILYGMLQIPATAIALTETIQLEPYQVCLAAIVLGYGLQDLAHYLCGEKTYLQSYIGAKPWMLVVHSVFLLPLVIDAVLMRDCYLSFLPTRNSCIATNVASAKACDDVRKWINETIPMTPETTHVWPHENKGTDGPVTDLEHDDGIIAAFRKVFSEKHYDIRPVQPMNEIYVTAVGAKKNINSDAVFYTPHTDGPYWFLPSASLYRVLVGVTPNRMVRTRFNLQHESQDKILDMYNAVGFDYSKEVHWIDHVPGVTNTERRSVIKLHFIVYPKGWHRYGQFCASLNTNYNTWARNNFLRTLRPTGIYEYVLAWWIWLTTWTNAVFEINVGWINAVYIALSYAMGPAAFLILTSFRHYAIYMTTFAYRQPNVAHGYLMRDAKLYKTISMMHLGRRILPMVKLPQDAPVVALACMGFMVTILATARLGMVRTYFGSELGLVKPQWIEGFPYGYIPHPMIMGQIFAFGAILYWYWNDLAVENMQLLMAHIGCYTAHMIQEMLTSSY